MPLYAVSDSPTESCPMKKELSFIRMADNKKRALINFLSVIPTIATKACTVDDIRRGFITAGIIDEQRKQSLIEYSPLVDVMRRLLNTSASWTTSTE